MALYTSFSASHTNWSTPSTGSSSVVLVVVLMPEVLFHCVTLTMSSCARLDEFKFARPLVQVVHTLASDAVQLRRGLMYAQALYVLQSSSRE